MEKTLAISNLKKTQKVMYLFFNNYLPVDHSFRCHLLHKILLFLLYSAMLSSREYKPAFKDED